MFDGLVNRSSRIMTRRVTELGRGMISRTVETARACDAFFMGESAVPVENSTVTTFELARDDNGGWICTRVSVRMS